MTHTPETRPAPLSWRDPVLWLLVGPPLAAVLGGIATVWIAATHVDPLVDRGVRKVGVTWQKDGAPRDDAPRDATRTPDDDGG